MRAVKVLVGREPDVRAMVLKEDLGESDPSEEASPYSRRASSLSSMSGKVCVPYLFASPASAFWADSKRYPTPWTVYSQRGLRGSSPSLARRFFTCESMVRS